MPIPTVIGDLSTSAASNSPAGSDPPTEGDNYLRAISAILKQFHTDLGTAGTPAVGAGMVGFNTAATYATASVGYELAQLRDSVLPVTRFGAVGDGVTDDSTAIQAAVDAAEALSATSVYVGIYFPPAVGYLIGTTITVQANGIGFYGDPGYGTVIKGNVLLFDVGIATARVTRVNFRHLFFSATSTTNSTAAIKLYRTTQTQIDNCIFSGWSIGVDCYRASTNDISHCRFNIGSRTTQAEAFIKLQGTDETAFASPATYTPGGGMHLTDCEGDGENATVDTASAIAIYSCDGLYVNNFHWTGCLVGINICPDATPANHYIFSIRFENCYADEPSTVTASPYSVLLGGTVKQSITMASGATETSGYENLAFINCEFRGALVAQQSVRIDVTDGDSWWDATRKLDRISFIGCDIASSKQNLFLSRGANASRIEATNLHIDSCRFKNGYLDGGGPTTGWAISAECESLSITNNLFSTTTGDADYVVLCTVSDAGNDAAQPGLIATGNNFSRADGYNSEILRISQTAINGNILARSNIFPGVGRFEEEQQHLVTTDATATTLWDWTAVQGQAGLVEAYVTGSNSDGSRTITAHLRAHFLRDGTSTRLSSVTSEVNDPDAEFATDPTIDLSTHTIRVRVVGIAATTINWFARVNLITSR